MATWLWIPDDCVFGREAKPMKSAEDLSRLLAPYALSWIALTLLATPVLADGVLYFADIFYPDWEDGTIYSVSTDGSGLQAVVDVGGGLRAVAIDPEAGKLYWTDVDNDLIRRANLDGSDPEDLISSGLEWPMGIALHPAADMLCWGDQTLRQIGSAHLDGSGAGHWISTGFHSGIAFDTCNDKLYWSTSSTASIGGIARANLDASGFEAVITDADKPARIALDVAGGKIYWTDYVVDVVRRANLDGSGVEDLYVVGANLNPGGLALDLEAGKVYWGQSHATNRHKIMRMNLDGTDPEEVLTGNFGIITDMTLLSLSSDVAEQPPVPVILQGIWPNPCADETTIGLRLAHGQSLKIAICGIDGHLVATLFDGVLPAGAHEIRWNGTGRCGHHLPAGIYFCRIATGGVQCSKMMTLLR
jgi:hypothetical protein